MNQEIINDLLTTTNTTDENKLFVKTLNNQGYMAVQLDDYSKEFIEYAVKIAPSGAKVLEIGAAYGVATLEALSKGAHVFCNDLSQDHLAIVKQKAEEKNIHQNLVLVPGEFPDGLTFEENMFDAILISRVLHFFDEKKLLRSLQLIFNWLTENGRLFVVGETPFLGGWQTFLPEFYRRKNNNERWPGLITDISKYNKTHVQSLPPLIHFMDQATLFKTLKEVGFNVERISYINRKGQFPADLLLDGRESVGAHASKPKL